jgi:hypothetical protein
MRPNHFAILMILLAAAAAPGQTPSGDGFPRPPGPVPLPAPPSALPQLPSVSMPPPMSLTRMDPAMAVEENVKPFDPQRLEVRYDAANGWELMVDGAVLKTFGTHDSDAKTALRLLRELGVNQHGTVGAPVPVMEYWLRDGRAPHGATAGLQVYPLDSNTLRVEQAQDHWCLRDAQRMLFDFGASEADARQAMGVIRKHGFTQIGALGEGGPLMLIFFGRGASGPAPAPLVPSVTVPSPIKPVRFERPMTPLPIVQHVPANGAATPGLHPAVPIITNVAGPDGLVERTPMDWRQTKLVQDGHTWKLVSDKQEIAKFTSEREAQLALSSLLYYRFTERDQVGSPRAHFTYFLADGQLPRGAVIGVPVEVFQPDRLRVTEVGGRWTISTAERVLLSFDDKADEARHVLDVIQQNKCDRLYHIGQGDEFGMTFLARSR